MRETIKFAFNTGTLEKSLKEPIEVRSLSDLKFILKNDLGLLKADSYDISFRSIDHKEDGFGDVYCVEYTNYLGTFIMGWSNGVLP